MVGYELRLRDIQLEADLAADLPLVAGDRYEIQQVVVNLLTNAVQAVGNNPPGRPRIIRIGTTAAPDAVTLRVADTGPGITDDALPHIFTPFYTTKEAGHGTGLGLSVSFGIVERHGGRLNAERAPDGGALFALTLPAVAVEPAGSSGENASSATAAPGSAAPRQSDPTNRKRTILLVDDDPAFRRMIHVIFSKNEQLVEEAPSAAEALRQLERRNFDLVIADPRAAVSAGEMLADVLLRRWPALRDRTILVTGDVRSETDEWLKRLGCRYFRKPFKVSELQAQAAEMLEPADADPG